MLVKFVVIVFNYHKIVVNAVLTFLWELIKFLCLCRQENLLSHF